MAPPRRPDPEPLELDNPRVVAALTLAWLLALVVLLVAAAAGADVHGWWLAMCACGVVLGVLGLRYMAVRKVAVRKAAFRAATRRRTGSRSSSAGSG